MKLPSPSKLQLAMSCQHPFTSGIPLPKDESKASNYGHAAHKWLELCVRQEVVSPSMVAEQYRLSDSERSQLEDDAATISGFVEDRRAGWDKALAEQIIAYDVRTGSARLLKEFRERRRDEIIGVIDLLVRHTDGSLLAFDLKTGRQRHTEDAASNPQMLFTALAVSRLTGAATVRVELGYVEPGRIWIDGHDVNDFAMDGFAAQLEELLDKLSHGPTPPVPGPWCTQSFCALRGQCSATRAALAELAPADYDLAAIEIKSPEQASRMYAQLPKAQAVLEAVKKAINEYAKHTPIDAGNGKVYAWREQSKRAVKIDGNERAQRALRDVLGDAADLAIETKVSATLSGIDKAVREVAESSGLKMAHVRREVLSALEAAGGLVVNKWVAPEEFERLEEPES